MEWQPVYCLQVVHGGDNDVLWLQRDYHIYMVNVFDTEKACQVRCSMVKSLMASMTQAQAELATASASMHFVPDPIDRVFVHIQHFLTWPASIHAKQQ